MSERIPSLIVKDILTCVDHLRDYTANLTFDEFSSNFMVVEACLYNLQIIGEAAGRLPEDVKKSLPHIPWALIRGMRNRLIHEYFGTDLPVVWNVIAGELPAFRTELETMYGELSKRGR